MRRLVIAGVAVLLLPLAGCGDPTEDYCSQLREDRKEFAEMLDSESSSALLGNLPMLRDLAEKSPDDLSDEWQTYVRAIEGLDKAIKDAGVKPSDFNGGKAPSGLSKEDQQAIAEAAGQITTQEVIEAASGIEQQARDVCKVNLGL
jgi:hypothetical protein